VLEMDATTPHIRVFALDVTSVLYKPWISSYPHVPLVPVQKKRNPWNGYAAEDVCAYYCLAASQCICAKVLDDPGFFYPGKE
jgi:hypothetical protein